MTENRPITCRNRMRDEGRQYPKSGCYHCGKSGMFGCQFENTVTNDEGDLRERVVTLIAEVVALTAELERARGALVAHNDYLRTSYQVAKRHGINTDWNLLAAALLRVLTDHHQTSNAARWPDVYDEAARDFLAREGNDDEGGRYY